MCIRDRDEANKDGSTIKWFLIEKLAASTLELTNHRHAHSSIGAVGPTDVPLVRLRIVSAQTETLNSPGWASHFEFSQVGAAIPDFPHDGCPIVFNPGCRPGKRFH